MSVKLEGAIRRYLNCVRMVDGINCDVRANSSGGLGVRIMGKPPFDISRKDVERFYVNLAADGNVGQVLRDIVAKLDLALFPPPPPRPLRKRLGAGKRNHPLTKRQWLGA
jgi:hypothetical protein